MKKLCKLLAGLTAFVLLFSSMPVITFAEISDYVNVNTDSADGWGTFAGTVALDTQNYKEGSGSVKVLMPSTRDGGGADCSSIFSDVSTVSVNDYPYVELYVYHSALTGGNAFQICTIDTDANGWNGYNYTYVANDEAAGWYRLSTDVKSNWHVDGINPDNINRIRVCWQSYVDYKAIDFAVDGVIFYDEAFKTARTAEETRINELVSALSVPTSATYAELKDSIETVISDVETAKTNYPNFMLADQTKLDNIISAYNEIKNQPSVVVRSNCDSITNWGAYNGTPSLDNVNFLEGTGSVKVTMPAVRDGAGQDFTSLFTDINTISVNDYPYVEALVYHDAFTGSNAIQICTIDSATNGGNGYNFTHVANDEAAGWYRLSTDVKSNWHVDGINPDNIDRIRVCWQSYGDYYVNNIAVDGIIFYKEEFKVARTAEETRVKGLVDALSVPTAETYASLKDSIEAAIAAVEAGKAEYPNFMLENQEEYEQIVSAYEEIKNQPLVYVASDCDSADGWNAYGGSVALNTDNYIQGTGSIKVTLPEVRDGSGQDFTSLFTTFDTLSLNQYPYVEAFVYHGAFTGSNAIQICTIDENRDGANGYNFTHVADNESAGWYRLSTEVQSNWHFDDINPDNISKIRICWQCYGSYYVNDFGVDQIIFYNESFKNARAAEETRLKALVEAAQVPTAATIDTLKAQTEALIADVNASRDKYANLYLDSSEAKFTQICNAYSVLSDNTFVNSAIEFINAIGEVTKDNFSTKLAAIIKAEDAANTVIGIEGNAERITNYTTLTAARAAYDQYALEEKTVLDAQKTKVLIDKIGELNTLTIKDRGAILKAKEAFDALSAESLALLPDGYADKIQKSYEKLQQIEDAAPDYISADNCDSIANWATSDGGTVTVDKENYLEGTGSVKGTMPDTFTGDGIYHYAMLCSFQNPVDVEYYNHAEIMLYNSETFVGSNGVHLSFSDPNTGSWDGYNCMQGVDNRTSGWNRYSFNVLENWKLAGTSADNISQFRFYWLNYGTYYPMTFNLDNLVFLTDDLYNARTDEETRIESIVSAMDIPTAATYAAVKESLASLNSAVLTAKGTYPNFFIEDQVKLESILAAYYSLGQSDVVAAAVSAVNAIGEVTAQNYKDKLVLIQTAESYAAVIEKNYGINALTNYETLTKARSDYNNFVIQADYQKKADEISALITALPSPEDVKLSDKTNIRAARDKLNNSTDEVKALVSQDLKTKLEADLKKLDELLNPYTPGNVDMSADNKVTAADALLALQHSVKKITLKDNAFLAADVDESGDVTAADALQILQFSVNKISEFSKVNK